MQRKEHTDTKSGHEPSESTVLGEYRWSWKTVQYGLNSKPNLTHSNVRYAVSGLRYGKLGNIDMQIVLQHCCYTS